MPNTHLAQDVLNSTEMILQDVRKIAMQDYIKEKSYNDKKENASKLKERDWV